MTTNDLIFQLKFRLRGKDNYSFSISGQTMWAVQKQTAIVKHWTAIKHAEFVAKEIGAKLLGHDEKTDKWKFVKL